MTKKIAKPTKKLGYGTGLTNGSQSGSQAGGPQPKYPRQTMLGSTKKNKK